MNLETFLSLAGIYLFIGVGFGAKWAFKEKIDDKTLVLLSVYFLQIFLTFWGLLKRPIDTQLLFAPTLYLGITLMGLLIMIPIARWLFADDIRDRSIATVAALIGNTGNLGIPLGITLFGEGSVAYLTLINLVNVFVVYTLGVFYYSRGKFSVTNSLMNILKLPVLWAAFVAIALNLNGYHPSPMVDKTLMMGAYASMTIQLVLLGIYLYGIKITHLNLRLTLWITFAKLILVPLIAFGVLHTMTLPLVIKEMVLLAFLVPLAVANVNLASLYGYSVRHVTVGVLVTSVLFFAVACMIPTLFGWF